MHPLISLVVVRRLLVTSKCCHRSGTGRSSKSSNCFRNTRVIWIVWIPSKKWKWSKEIRLNWSIGWWLVAARVLEKLHMIIQGTLRVKVVAAVLTVVNQTMPLLKRWRKRGKCLHKLLWTPPFQLRIWIPSCLWTTRSKGPASLSIKT